MKNLTHPAFLTGIIGGILFFVGLGFKTYGYRLGDAILYAGIVLGGVCWIWSIIDVSRRDDLRYFQKTFWLIAVITIPVVGGLIFYVLHQDRDKLVT